jgi:hypothetical protein
MRFLRIFALIALCLALLPSPAVAVTGYDSSYNSESAFVTIVPGETKSFQVFFVNTGTVTWIKGSSSQVDLATCLENKTTCNAQDASEASWNSGWLSAVRYATTTQATVAPGSVATFAYNIKAPSDATGTHRFNGDLVLAATGDRIHPEGYYQDATVEAIGSVPGPTPTPPPPAPTAAPARFLRAEAGVFCDGISSTASSCTTPANPQGPFGPALASTVTAGWMSQGSNEVLHLAKECAEQEAEGTCLAANSSAGAEITVNGGHYTLPIGELGFDVAPGAYCGAGAPRFNVYTAPDFSTAQFFGCAGGTQTTLPNGWTRVTFGPVAGPVFALEIIQDEPGSTILDNINVNGAIITNSGGTIIP